MSVCTFIHVDLLLKVCKTIRVPIFLWQICCGKSNSPPPQHSTCTCSWFFHVIIITQSFLWNFQVNLDLYNRTMYLTLGVRYFLYSGLEFHDSMVISRARFRGAKLLYWPYVWVKRHEGQAREMLSRGLLGIFSI